MSRGVLDYLRWHIALYQRTQRSPLRVRSMSTIDTDAPAPWATRESSSGDPRRALLPRPRMSRFARFETPAGDRGRSSFNIY